MKKPKSASDLKKIIFIHKNVSAKRNQTVTAIVCINKLESNGTTNGAYVSIVHEPERFHLLLYEQISDLLSTFIGIYGFKHSIILNK